MPLKALKALGIVKWFRFLVKDFCQKLVEALIDVDALLSEEVECLRKAIALVALSLLKLKCLFAVSECVFLKIYANTPK